MDHLRGRHPDHDGARPGRAQPPRARGLLPRSLDLVRGLGLAGPALQPGGVVVAGTGRRPAVPDRLSGGRVLSVDNLFVFILIFSYFRVPSQFQHKVLFWGILGAVVMRAESTVQETHRSGR